MTDAGFDLALTIGVLHAARQSYGAKVLQHVAIERVQFGVVDVRGEHALAKVIEDDNTRDAT